MQKLFAFIGSLLYRSTPRDRVDISINSDTLDDKYHTEYFFYYGFTYDWQYTIRPLYEGGLLSAKILVNQEGSIVRIQMCNYGSGVTKTVKDTLTFLEDKMIEWVSPDELYKDWGKEKGE